MDVCSAFRWPRPESSSYAIVKVLVKPNANNIFFQKSIRRWQGVKSERLDEYMFNEKIPESVQPNGS
jgi:hypothetical protein